MANLQMHVEIMNSKGWLNQLNALIKTKCTKTTQDNLFQEYFHNMQIIKEKKQFTLTSSHLTFFSSTWSYCLFIDSQRQKLYERNYSLHIYTYAICFIMMKYV